MPLPTPVDRRTLIRKLKNLGFEGPYAGGKHQYMLKEQHKLVIPNPHKGDISGALLVKIFNKPAFHKRNGNGYNTVVLDLDFEDFTKDQEQLLIDEIAKLAKVKPHEVRITLLFARADGHDHWRCYAQ
jgi:hypothetical protein